MASKLVRVELGFIRTKRGEVWCPIRIFKDKSWLTCLNPVQLMDKSEAVRQIREQVLWRARDFDRIRPVFCIEAYACERCGRNITWDTFEMNEKRPKGAGGGKTGGEVSLENCEALCHQCHTGSPDSAHGDRRWQTAKSTSDEGQNG